MPITTWLYAVSLFLNASFGALLVLLPKVNEGDVGIAYFLFFASKAFYLPFAGMLSDRLGHFRAMTLAALLQLAGLALILSSPSLVTLGRILEGLGLAQGTVSSICLARLALRDRAVFERVIGRLASCSSTGFLVGAIFGVTTGKLDPRLPIAALCLGVVAIVLVQYTALAPSKLSTEASPAPAPATPDRRGSSDVARAFWVASLGAAKGFALGWLPVLAWWSERQLGHSTVEKSLVFLLVGAGFALGALVANRAWLAVGLVAALAIEAALTPQFHWLWWPALLAIGVWYGSAVTLATGALGWRRQTDLGFSNSIWLLLTDLPAGAVTWLLWSLKSPGNETSRLVFGTALLLVAALPLALGVRPRLAAESEAA